MIWLCQPRCFAKVLYAKSRIDKIPYANIPTDKIPYAENALCRNSNCPNALQPKNQEAGSILKVNFALSKLPHLHRGCLETVCNERLIAVFPRSFRSFQIGTSSL